MADNIEKRTEKKKKTRFNIVDIIIIVAVIACIGGIVLRVVLTDRFQANNVKDYIVTFKADGLSYAQLLGIEKALDESESGGNFVSFADKSVKIGNLYGITDSELLYVESHNGERITFEIGEDELNTFEGDDSWKDDSVWYIKGTMICSGEYSEDKGFLLGGNTYMAANQMFDVTTKYTEFTIKILGIEEYK